MRRSTLESSGRNAKKVKLAKKPSRDWLDLPLDVMANILRRIGVVEIVENARKVCTTWYEICKDICEDPSMWRVIYVDAPLDQGKRARRIREQTCKYVLGKSRGQLVDLTVVNSQDWELLSHIAQRSRQLKRLVFGCCGVHMFESWSVRIFKNFTFLEELSLFNTPIDISGIERAGKYCNLLTTLKLNQKPDQYWGWNEDYIQDGMATTIAERLPGLRHLELIGNNMSDNGLRSVLDGCPHLESLDLRGCYYIQLKGALRQRLFQTIIDLKWPSDSLEGCPYIYEYLEWFHRL